MAGTPTTPQPSVRVLWRPEQFTRVSNPIFASATTGWAVTAGINAAGTSITRITTDFYEGSACGSLVCGTTDGGGVNFDLGADRYFAEASYGAAYIAVVWLKRTSGSRRARVILGSEGTAADRVTLLITDLVDSWAPYTVRWLPTADRTDAQLAITNGSAEALTVKIGKATVYQVDAFSQVENGTFETDTTGWSVAAGNFAAAATSITRTAGGFGGSYCGRLVTTAVAASGATFDLGNRKFTSGRTYRARIATKTVSGTATYTLHLGSPTAGDSATAAVTAGASFAWSTVDWTPAADRTDVEVAIYSDGTTVRTVDVDELEVYEASDDLGNDVQHLRWTRALDAIGTISCQVLNHDGTYDPRNASAALYGSLTPGKRIWGRATHGGALYPLFYGTLTTIEAPPLGGVHTDLVAEDMMGALSRADVSVDFAQDDSYKDVRGYIINAVVSAQSSATSAPLATSKRLRATGIEGDNHYRGTDGPVPALGLLDDLNEATGTVHHVMPSVHANIGWVYTTVDRANLTDDSSDFSIDEDFADLTGTRLTHEALENRQEVPWQAYEALPPDNANNTGFGLVVVARDVSVYGTTDEDDPYLHYTDDEYGSDDAHPDPRWRYPQGMTAWRWRKRRKRGLKVPRRRRVFLHPFVPIRMVAGDVERVVIDFAIPVSGAIVLLSDETDTYIWLDADTGTHTVLVDYIESRPNRLVVDLRCVSADTVSLFEVYGTPWLPLDDLTETTHGYQSQADHGIHPGPTIGTAYIPSKAAAEGIGNYRNWRYGSARLRPTLHLAVGQVATTVAVDPADHITLSADRWRIDTLLFLVSGGTWEVRTKGMEWTCQLDIEELPTHTDWLTLDHATLGLDEAVVLAY